MTKETIPPRDRIRTRPGLLDRILAAFLPTAPTPSDLWKQARINHIEAVRRGDTRAMGQARRAMRVHAHDALRMELGK